MAQLQNLVIDLSAQERLDRYQVIVETLAGVPAGSDALLDLATFDPARVDSGRVLAQRRPLR